MNLKLVVGLGNPGAKYADTRHNAGYAVVFELARRWSASGKTEPRFKAVVAKAEVGAAGLGRQGPAGGQTTVLLAQPVTFMNLSGEAVSSLVSFYRIPLDHLLVMSDDVDLPVGSLRLRKQGSSGGQKGLESVIQHLGTGEFPRLRIGVGPKAPLWTLEDWVLAKLTAQERPVFQESIVRAADAVELWVQGGDFEAAMSRYNTPRAKPG